MKILSGIRKKLEDIFTKGLQEEVECLRRELLSMEENIESVRENLQNNNVNIENMGKNLQNNNVSIENMGENLQNNNVSIENMGRNLQNNNLVIESLDKNIKNVEKEMADWKNEITIEMEEARQESRMMTKYLTEVNKKSIAKDEIIHENDNISSKMDSSNENAYSSIDYFDFEDYFRGKRHYIKKVQEQYLPYFQNCNNVIDLGCGRGEFLELLKDNNIKATGVDFYDEFVYYDRMHDLEVYQGDAIEELRKRKSVDGIFAGQLVEHLEVEQIMELCNLAYEKLEDNSYLILETPNPTSLAIYTNSFYIDPSHVKPVHPKTLEYYLKKAGFQKIEILYTENSKLPYKIPVLESDNIANIAEFNEAMKVVSNTLFGSQDYAIIAQK